MPIHLVLVCRSGLFGISVTMRYSPATKREARVTPGGRYTPSPLSGRTPNASSFTVKLVIKICSFFGSLMCFPYLVMCILLLLHRLVVEIKVVIVRIEQTRHRKSCDRAAFVHVFCKPAREPRFLVPELFAKGADRHVPERVVLAQIFQNPLFSTLSRQPMNVGDRQTQLSCDLRTRHLLLGQRFDLPHTVFKCGFHSLLPHWYTRIAASRYSTLWLPKMASPAKPRLAIDDSSLNHGSRSLVIVDVLQFCEGGASKQVSENRQPCHVGNNTLNHVRCFLVHSART